MTKGSDLEKAAELLKGQALIKECAQSGSAAAAAIQATSSQLSEGSLFSQDSIVAKFYKYKQTSERLEEAEFFAMINSITATSSRCPLKNRSDREVREGFVRQRGSYH